MAIEKIILKSFILFVIFFSSGASGASNDGVTEPGDTPYDLSGFDIHFEVNWPTEPTTTATINVPGDMSFKAATAISGCRIVVADNMATIEDLGSTNGTKVNEVLLKNPVPLIHKDKVLVGGRELTVYFLDEDEQDAAGPESSTLADRSPPKAPTQPPQAAAKAGATWANGSWVRIVAPPEGCSVHPSVDSVAIACATRSSAATSR